MYHPSVPCPAHVFLLLDFSCTTTLVPGGAIGVALKLKLPSNAANADSEGFRQDERNKLMVILHCGISLSHSLDGNLGLQVYKPATK